MECLHCGSDNREGAQFCHECGASLAIACPNCGAAIAPGNKFCDSCGASLTPSPLPHRFRSPEAYTPPHLVQQILSSKSGLEGERKQVTVMLADLKSSMELLADRDPEEARQLLDPVLTRMMDAVHYYEGTVNQVMGDGIMALFGAPIAHEDHAVRACYAALKLQESVRRYSEDARRSHGVPLFIRIGLNSGEVVVRSIRSDLHMDYTAVGQTTHLAARMEQMAMPGTVLLTPATLKLAEGFVDVKPLGPAQIKGVQNPLELFELTGARAVRSRLQAAAVRGLTKFVGRDAELAQIHRAVEHAASGHGQVVAIMGEPGVGKSRLVWEVTHSHRTRNWLVLESYSVSYGKATPWLPIVALLRSYCRINDGDDPRAIEEKLTGKILTLDRALEPTLLPLRALLDAATDDPSWAAMDPKQRREKTLEALKQLLFRESQIQPLLLVFEDLHWIDTETQALLDSLVETLPASRVLMFVDYRPEYQHRWGSKTYYTQIRLDPLPPESAEELLAGLLGPHQSLAPLKSLLITRTGGNPFFLEESVRELMETHVLAGEPGVYQLAKAAEAIHVPPTVQTVLAARIDRLSVEDKRILQTAAVLGKDVSFRPLAMISDVPDPDLHRALERLQASEFVYETRLFPDSEYTFKHALTHEVAYGSLLQDRRRELHRRAGAALERVNADHAEEVYSVLARHFAEGEELEKGLQYSALAAEKAAALYAYEEAVRHFEQAKSLADRLAWHDRRVQIDEAIGDVEVKHGHLEQAVAAYDQALAHSAERLKQAELKFKVGRVYSMAADPRGLPLLQNALQELDPELQRVELIHAQALLGRYHHYAGEHTRAHEVLKGAYALAEPLDNADLLTTILTNLAGACQHLARYEESMYWTQRALEFGERKNFPSAVLLGYEFMAENLANTGRWDDAIAFSDREYSLAASMGAIIRMAWAMHARAYALWGKGELRAALEAIKTTANLVLESGEKRLGLWCDVRLAMILTDLGDDGAAREAAVHGIKAADDQKERVLGVLTRLSFAYFFLQRENWQAAPAIFEETEGILGRSDNRLTRLIMGPLKTEALLGLGRLSEADAAGAEAVNLARESGDRHTLGVALSAHGGVLGAMNRRDGAARALTEAVTTLSETGSQLSLGRALVRRSRLRFAASDAAGAQQDLVEALRLFSANDARPDRQRVERELAQERVRG